MFVLIDIILVSPVIVNRKKEYSAELQMTCRESGVHRTERRAVTVRGLRILYHRRGRKSKARAPHKLKKPSGERPEGFIRDGFKREQKVVIRFTFFLIRIYHDPPEKA